MSASLAFVRIVAELRCSLAIGATAVIGIPETVLSVDSQLLCHYKQIVIQPVHVSSPVLLLWARVQPVHHQLEVHPRSQLVHS